MDEVMLRYRTASFFGKLYAPELLMGLQTTEEMHDIIDATPSGDGTIEVDVDALRGTPAPAKPKPAAAKTAKPEATDTEFKERTESVVDQDTGEVTDAAPEYIDHDKVSVAIASAKDHDVLSVAADLIADTDPAHHEALGKLYRQRLDELDGVQHVPEQTAAPARSRRAAAADME
jgi:hypothetical protein